MPDPKKQDPDVQPSPPPDPYRKSPSKPVGRDSDATPGQGTEPTRTPNRIDPQQESGDAPAPHDWTGQEKSQQEHGGADADPFMIG